MGIPSTGAMAQDVVSYSDTPAWRIEWPRYSEDASPDWEASLGLPDYPPLLPGGLHAVTVDRLRELCLTPFGLSQSRPVLMENLAAVIAELIRLGVPGELWVDGSFLTSKLEPKDVDMALRIRGPFYDRATPEQRQAVDAIEGRLLLQNGFDSYVFFELPADHPDYAMAQVGYDYWKGLFGSSREDAAKGIAVVALAQ